MGLAWTVEGDGLREKKSEGLFDGDRGRKKSLGLACQIPGEKE